MLLRLIRLTLSMILPVVFANGALAQETPSPHGSRIVVVADSVSRKPLSFASAVFRDTRKGVIADLDGKLLMKLPLPGQTLTISRIGYQPKRIKPSDLPDTVFLVPVPESLKEVVVKASDQSDPR